VADDKRCPKCGYVMIEKFAYRRVNEDTEIAVPTGQFSCIKCDDEEMRARTPKSAV
jgi:hypothetical protein